MDTAALKDSWATAGSLGDQVPLYFYSHLFLSHPEVRSMFPIQMSGQRDKLVGALGEIVSNVDQIDEVVAFIEQLGRDHRRFGVVADHYQAVGASLLATLKHFFGDAWTEDLARDWAEAYGLIAKVMVAAAEDSEEVTPAWWEAEVTAVERRTLDVAVVSLRPSQRLDFTPGQSIAMEIPQRPRMWRYYSPANAPRQDGTLELHVQPVDGGQVSPTVVRKLRQGDVVRLGAPVGYRLTMQPDDRSDLVLVAGGTGLAPLRATLEQADRTWQVNGSGPQVHLFHGARMPWNLYEHDLLSQMSSRPWFTYTPVVSEDRTYPGTQGLVGTVAAQQPRADSTYLVCGSPAMVTHTVAALQDAGIEPGRIRSEEFKPGTRQPEPEMSVPAQSGGM